MPLREISVPSPVRNIKADVKSGQANADTSLKLSTMSSVLRQLSGPHRSLADLADVLEKHLGDGTNGLRCEEALAALRQVHKWNTNYYLGIVLRDIEASDRPCEVLRKVITTLRKWNHFSGA